MKWVTKITHSIVYNLRLEIVFVQLGNIHPIFLKFLPLHYQYKHGERRIVQRNGVKFNLDLSDYMQWHIFARQPDNSWREAVKFLKDNTSFLDIGANCGAFTLSVAQQIFKKRFKECKVYAFEPNPYIFNFLQKNLSLNPQLSEIVSLEQLGVGERSGGYGMVFNKRNSGHGQVVDMDAATNCKVTVITIDDFITQHQLENVCFVKIDVEGYEPLVLKGAAQLLLKQHPALFIEITENWFREKGYSQRQIFENLYTLGYSLFAEFDEDFVKLIPSVDIYSHNQFNALAVYGQ